MACGSGGTSVSGAGISEADGRGAKFDFDLGRIGIRLGLVTSTSRILSTVPVPMGSDPGPFDLELCGPASVELDARVLDGGPLEA